MPFVVSDKNKRELSQERDFPGLTPITYRYCILSSPRSGSTLLSRMLNATGLGGDPLEYFNHRLIDYERQRTDNPTLSINAFIDSMEKRRTSPNGVFGIKMHYSQLLGAFGSQVPTQNMLDYLKHFDALILIRRRDRIRQAVSQVIGLHTQVWSSEDSRFGTQPESCIHPMDCINALHQVCREDFGWEQLISTTGLKVLEVWYEDLVVNYEMVCREVITHLELAETITVIPSPQIERQASELNERLYGEVLNYIRPYGGSICRVDSR